jgi:hypothetical protein
VTLPAIKLLFFVLNNSTILIVKIIFGFGVGDHFVLYEFDESDAIPNTSRASRG